MTLIYILITAIAILLIVNIFLTLKAGKKENNNELFEIKNLIAALTQNLKDTERNLKEEFATNRRESSDSATGLRTEVVNQLNKFTQTFSDQLVTLTNSVTEKFSSFQNTIDTNNKDNRKELKENLEAFKTNLNDGLKNFNEKLRENFTDFINNQKTQNEANTIKLGELKTTLENSVNKMQESNEKKLEEMRKTVDEKLNDTLEKRLGESFRLVSERLEAVHRGLGDMQTLAGNVGDLKKVMSNVKSRGVLGEYQLQNLLEDLLTNEQYEKNVRTKIGSGAIVEFAIKMPHGNNVEKILWLPVDSKFPKEDYESLVDAYEKADLEKIEEFRKAFVKGIKQNARDIKEKYIDPPNTTEYGIMFLPYESLYGEVLRTPGLFEQLQRDYKITITGPTTLSALLNSLQMGFRTLAIEKRSSEVWDLLGAVKTEFGQFGIILEKTKKKLDEAVNVIDTAGVRTRAIERKLRNVQELPQEKSKLILEVNNETETEGEEYT
jgi:DNA recombination protein RmuC